MLLSAVLFVLFGFVVGLVAELLAGGPAVVSQTVGMAIAGALIGGMIAHGMGWMNTPWSIAGFLMALLGAMTLITVSRAIQRTT